MDNVKAAVGAWLGRWYAQIAPTQPSVQEFAARGLSKSVVLVPGRMIDAAQDMVNLWTRNDTNAAPGSNAGSRPPKLPVAMVAMARDMMPTGRDWGRSSADEQYVTFASDPKERVFGLRTHLQDLRCQLVIAAHEPDAAKSLAAQFSLWVQGHSNKHALVDWVFAGQSLQWPIQLESDDVMGSLVPTDAKNLTLLALDFTFKMTEPYYRAPQQANEFDGKGTTRGDGTNDPADPHGFALVRAVETLQSVVAPTSDAADPMHPRVTTEAGTSPKDCP